jgi:hypothetical protein
MKQYLRIIATMMCAGLFLAGCASGPTFSKISSTIPELSSDMGRIYFYRSSSPFGAGVQPAIMLNGTKVGDSIPGGVFFKDVSPGDYEVATSTEVKRKLTFTVAARQSRYVETSVGVGFLVGRVHPTLVDPAVGKKAIQELSFTGKQ